MLNRTLVARAMIVVALLLAAIGVALLIEPERMLQHLGATDQGTSEPTASLLAAALLGFAALNWVGREALVGGVYGRALVIGNQVHFVVGSLVLIRRSVESAAHLPIVALAGLYVCGAVLFSVLMFRGPR